ncbi:MAG TPA: DUF3500 domain-containing protein [Saprospiraceae bacterium]|nr:DUF3500 domain-containing protein [Saprospiraceae bacterium]
MKLLFFLLLPVSLCAQVPKAVDGSTIANTFIHSLNEAQRKKALYPFEEMNRYEWHYLPATMVARQGVGIWELDSLQKIMFYDLLRIFLSPSGYDRTKSIMDYEYLLKEMQPTNVNRVPENYFVAIYGSPGMDTTWGWKFSGHHVALNFTIVHDQLAFAPFFFGVYPAEVKDGPKKGQRLIRDEEDLGFELANSMSESQKPAAFFQLKAFSDIVTTNAQVVAPFPEVGILARDMNMTQKATLNKLIAAYLLSMPAKQSDMRMKRIASEDMDNIRFGWAGGTSPGEPHYYRIQGKTFLIEFDNTQNSANHIHTAWRDFNGDFGEDLLREHYHTADHHHH